MKEYLGDIIFKFVYFSVSKSFYLKLNLSECFGFFIVR